MTDVLFPLPTSLVAPVAQLQADLNVGLQDASGVVTHISDADSATIVADARAIEAAAAPLMYGVDCTAASPAADAAVKAAAIANVVIQPIPGGVQFRAINPNLVSIAAQYLDDPSLWQTIAEASSIYPPDPQPIGLFTIIIPN